MPVSYGLSLFVHTPLSVGGILFTGRDYVPTDTYDSSYHVPGVFSLLVTTMTEPSHRSHTSTTDGVCGLTVTRY